MTRQCSLNSWLFWPTVVGRALSVTFRNDTMIEAMDNTAVKVSKNQMTEKKRHGKDVVKNTIGNYDAAP